MVQSVRKVNEGPRAGFLTVDEKTDMGLRGGEADVLLTTCKALDKVIPYDKI